MTAKATMISFACDGCGRAFSVPANFAGRKASCKTCGTKVIVPGPAARMPDDSSEAHAEPAGNGKPHRVAPANGTPHPTLEPAHSAPVPPPEPSPSAPRRRAPQVAIISEAQAPPAASAAPVLPSEALPSAGERNAVAPARPAPDSDVATRQPAPGEVPAKVPVRVRRLMADAEQMARTFTGDGLIRIKSTIGEPPELYTLEYHVKGLQKGWLGRPKVRDTHVVEIQLTSEYPRLSPKCRMLTPVFHPNIDETTICVTDHWTAGERLVDLVIRIGEMLAYQAYNIKSPLNGEAAMWADLHPKKLPVDERNLHPEA